MEKWKPQRCAKSRRGSEKQTSCVVDEEGRKRKEGDGLAHLRLPATSSLFVARMKAYDGGGGGG